MAFDYLSRHSVIRRRLMRDLKSHHIAINYYWIIKIMGMLSFHKLILRFIFKSMHIGLWRPLLSAEIAILSHTLLEDDYHLVLQGIWQSMPYWRTKQLLFAQKRGLFSVMSSELEFGIADQHPVGTRVIIRGILLFGYFLSLKFKIENILRINLDHLAIDFKQIMQTGTDMLQIAVMEENVCGWPPCHRMQTKLFKVSEVMYFCKGCRLIKYCCRSHQKKHRKFIHSQQCRKY